MYNGNSNRNRDPLLNFIPGYSNYRGIGGACASGIYNWFEFIIGLVKRFRQVTANGASRPGRLRVSGPRTRNYIAGRS